MQCLNCGAAITAQGRFCAQCGQRADTARLSVPDVVRDFMHSFVDIERSAFAFAWALFTRPGVLARDYVEGRRRRYFGPFATLAAMLALIELTVNASGFQVLANEGLTPGPMHLLQKHFNLVLLAQLPLLGGICALAFRSARLNLCEHMVLVAYTLGLRAIVIALLIPVWFLFSDRGDTPNTSVLGFMTIWFLYFGWAATQFYDGPTAWTWLRGSFAAALSYGAISVILLALDSAYRAATGS